MNGLRGLLGAELRRFFSRRVMHAMFAFGIALATFVLVLQFVRSDVSRSVSGSPNIVCNGPTSGPATAQTFGTLPPDCYKQFGTEIVTRDRRMHVHNTFRDTVNGTGVAMVFVAFVSGASFVGAEFGAGSLSTQLLFEPRRKRVVAVKAVAVGIGLAALSTALLLYIGILQWIGSSLRGVAGGLDGAWFAGRAADMGRVAAAVGLAGIAAYAITVVARRTVAAVAGLLIVGWASAIIGQFHAWRWVAKDNPATAFIAMAVDPSRQQHNGGSDVLSTRASSVSALGWAVGLTLAAAFIFDRREVR
ncbi:MAG TPA: hypothetical protein VIK61_11260 [Acidimicrobiia bacterium]